jgi:hypothetical protein
VLGIICSFSESIGSPYQVTLFDAHGKATGRYGEFDDLWLNEQSISSNFKQTALLRIVLGIICQFSESIGSPYQIMLFDGRGKTAGQYGEFNDLWLKEQSIFGNFKQTALLRIVLGIICQFSESIGSPYQVTLFDGHGKKGWSIWRVQ